MVSCLTCGKHRCGQRIFFLTDGEVSSIKAYVPQALAAAAHLIAAENENDAPIAFMGIEGGSLEMLFVSPEERGKGVGEAPDSVWN